MVRIEGTDSVKEVDAGSIRPWYKIVDGKPVHKQTNQGCQEFFGDNLNTDYTTDLSQHIDLEAIPTEEEGTDSAHGKLKDILSSQRAEPS